MNYKTCVVMNNNFKLDEQFAIYFAGKDGRRVPVIDGLEKGYIYASLYFYDEVEKEINKLEKMIRKIHDEIKADMNIPDPSIMLIELSKRVRDAIGDDSLDLLIKQLLGEQAKHIALLPEQKEIEKFDKIQESILIELLANFYDMTIRKATDLGEHKTITLAQSYVDGMTERQKKLLAPALKMIGFLNQVKLNDFELMPNFSIKYIPERMSSPFTAKEESIKQNLKKMMASNS